MFENCHHLLHLQCAQHKPGWRKSLEHIFGQLRPFTQVLELELELSVSSREVNRSASYPSEHIHRISLIHSLYS